MRLSLVRSVVLISALPADAGAAATHAPFALTNQLGSLWLIFLQESLVFDRLGCHCRNFRAADEAVICTPQVVSVELSDDSIITN